MLPQPFHDLCLHGGLPQLNGPTRATTVEVRAACGDEPKLISHRTWSPPFDGGTHSALPQPLRLESRNTSMMMVMKIQMHAIATYTQKIQTKNSQMFN